MNLSSTNIKHIAFVTPYYAPAWAYGGPPRVLHSLAKQLVGNGKKVSVFTTNVLDEKTNTKKHEKIDGVEVFRLPIFSNWLAYKEKIFLCPSFANFFKQKLQGIDVVIFSDVRSPLNWFVFQMLRERNIPYGIFSFGQIPYDSGWKGVIKRIFDILWVRIFILSAQWRFAQTPHEQRMYQQFFGCSLNTTQLLPLSIEYKKFTFQMIRSKRNNLVFVGRLHALKGVRRLIEWTLPILKRNKTVTLLVVGRDDGEEHALRTLVPDWAKDRVNFLGGVYGSAVTEIYRKAKCFVFLPTYPEETSTAALEALACGIPVITNHNAEIPYLTEYKAGYYAETLMEFEHQVKEVLARSTTKYYFKRCTSLIQDHFSAEKVTRELQNYIC